MTIRGTVRPSRIDPTVDAARLAWGRAFSAWMDGGGRTVAEVRWLCGVSAATVSKWRSGDAMPSARHLHTLERMGFEQRSTQ